MAQLISGTRIWGYATVDTQLNINGQIAASSTVTGALQVVGGAGIGGKLYVGDDIYSKNSLVLTAAALSSYGVSSIKSATGTAVSSTTGNITIWSTATLQNVTDRGATTNNAIKITDATPSSSVLTGALVVSGGVGVGENVYVGGQVAVSTITSISGDITIDPAGTSNVVFGTGAQVKILDTTLSSSTATGALVVSGGLGVAEDVYAGGNIRAVGDFYLDTATSYVRGTFTNSSQTRLIGINASNQVFVGSIEAGAVDVRLYAASGTPVIIFSSATRIATFATNGKVGIGATKISPVYDLDVSGTGNFDNVLSTGITATTITATNMIATSFITEGGNNVITTANISVGTGTAVSIDNVSGNFTIWSTATLQTVTGFGSSTTNAIFVNSSTAATSTITGALRVAGGVGVGGDIYVGKTLYINTVSSIGTNSPITINANGTGDLIISTGTQLRVYDTTTSISAITGALIVNGGAGISGNVYISGSINSQNITATTITATNFYGTIQTASQPNITGVGILNSLTATFVGTGPAISADTPNSINGGVRIRGNATSGLAILQFTNSTGATSWSTATVTSAGTMTYSGDLIVNGGIKFGSNPQGSAIRHVTTGYTNGSQIFVSTTQPTASAVGDIWIQI